MHVSRRLSPSLIRPCAPPPPPRPRTVACRCCCREAARALGNLSTRYESQPAVVEGRGVLGLVKCLRDEDVHVRHFGALGLVNLTNRPTFHPPAVDVGAIEALAVVADRADVLPRRYACLALGNLAITGLYNNHYVSSGAVPTLVAALSSDNEVETRFNAAYAIGKLAHDPGMHEGLALDNAIQGLLAVSYSDDAATQCQAVCALRLMSAHFPNMRRIIEMNSLDSLKATAQSTGLETQKETAGLLSNLTRIDENKILVAQHSILPHIFTLAKSAGGAGRLALAWCPGWLWRTAWRMSPLSRPRSQCAAGNVGMSRVCVPCWAMRVCAVVRVCVRAGGGARVMHADVECARHATGAIANIAEDTSTHEWIVKEEGVHFLVQLMRSRHLQVRAVVRGHNPSFPAPFMPVLLSSCVPVSLWRRLCAFPAVCAAGVPRGVAGHGQHPGYAQHTRHLPGRGRPQVPVPHRTCDGRCVPLQRRAVLP